jgi:hypothetical protein
MKPKVGQKFKSTKKTPYLGLTSDKIGNHIIEVEENMENFNNEQSSEFYHKDSSSTQKLENLLTASQYMPSTLLKPKRDKSLDEQNAYSIDPMINIRSLNGSKSCKRFLED